MPFSPGYEETGFLRALNITKDDIEPLAENCTKVRDQVRIPVVAIGKEVGMKKRTFLYFILLATKVEEPVDVASIGRSS